jgi:uncharacterized membrane protein
LAPIVSSVEVECPAEAAFAYVTDPSRFHQWQRDVVSGRVDGEPGQVGSRCVVTRRIGGRERTATQELTAIDPPRRWSVHGIDGPVRADVDVRIEPLDGNTRSRVTISLDFFGSGIGKLVVPLFVTPGAPREVAQSFETLKTRLDGAPAAD